MDSQRSDIPTPQEEALQEPAFDPILLLASVLSGGLSSLPEGLLNRQLRNDAAQGLKTETFPALRDILSSIASETPSLLKTTSQAAAQGGRNFAVGDLLANYFNAGASKSDNALGVANVPSGSTAAATPPIRELLKRLSDPELTSRNNVGPLMQIAPLAALMYMAAKKGPLADDWRFLRKVKP